MAEYNLVVAHYREIGLKGRNRSFFERTLANNMRAALQDCPGAKVRAVSGRILVKPASPDQFEQITDRLKKVFGLSSFSPAVEIPDPTLGVLTSTGVEQAQMADFESFAVRARRGASSFPETSQKVNEVVGKAILEASAPATVNLGKPDWTCHIELAANSAYLYSEKLEGPGGLPVGTGGRILALLSGGIDSPVAAWQVARRGASLDFIHFHGQPFSDPSSTRQATRLARHLSPWIGKARLWLIPFGDVQSEIVTAAPEQLRIILYRRFMMRIAEKLALAEGMEGLVTGESLGQVASQTLPNITATNDVVNSLPVLRPLIAFDKLDIETAAKRIGTYEISIEPHQDCCVLFIPRRVSTAAKLPDLEATEATLDCDAMIEKALANAEVIATG